LRRNKYVGLGVSIVRRGKINIEGQILSLAGFKYVYKHIHSFSLVENLFGVGSNNLDLYQGDVQGL